MSHSHIIRSYPRFFSGTGLLISIQKAIRQDKVNKWVNYYFDTQNTALKRLKTVNPKREKEIVDFLWRRN